MDPNRNSRREFFKQGVVLAASSSALTEQTAGVHETHSSAAPPWAPVRILDTEPMSWEHRQTRDAKVLFESQDKKSRLSIVHIPPRDTESRSRYRTSHEWMFGLAGDLVECEYSTAEQRVGALVRYREGCFVDRPPYSLHGFEEDRHMESQMGATLLVMDEGGRTVSPIPGRPGYSEEYKQVKEWGRPRVIDTIEKMPWEPDPSVPGRQAKHLADDQSAGFRAVLWWLPAGWTSSRSPSLARPSYYKQAYQFLFALAGDLNIQAHRAPTEKGEKHTLLKGFFLERPPMSIFGLADGVVSERGCVWLEVTYATGTSISQMPIEDPSYV